MKYKLPGINIQFPISAHIVSGEKIIETRTYGIPEHYLNKEIILVETPGKSKEFEARAVAIIKFSDSFKYKHENEFYKDINRHLVDKDSPWAWKKDKPKWGWALEVIKVFKYPVLVKEKRGIVFTKEISIVAD